MAKLGFSFLCFTLALVNAFLCGAEPTTFTCTEDHFGLTVQQFIQVAIEDARAKDTWVDILECNEDSGILARGHLPTDVEIYNSLVNTTVMSLGADSITGTIPPELGLLTNLKVLLLRSSQFTSTIPKELFIGLQNVSGLVFAGTIGGTIPSEVEKMSSLELIALSNTFLHGRILDHLSRLPSLSRIIILNSSFSGTIPSGLFTPKINTIDIRNNRFSGTIPTEIANLNETILITFGEGCRFEGNRFTGTMPEHKCRSDIAASFMFPTESPTRSPSGFTSGEVTSGPTILSPSDIPIIQPNITSDEMIFIMIAIGGILLALVTAYVIINENYKSIMKINVADDTHLEDDPRRPGAMLASELTL